MAEASPGLKVQDCKALCGCAHWCMDVKRVRACVAMLCWGVKKCDTILYGPRRAVPVS